MLSEDRICSSIGTKGWPSLWCHKIRSTLDQAVRAKQLNMEVVEKGPRLELGNLYRPRSRKP